jgi:competence protein ComEC
MSETGETGPFRLTVLARRWRRAASWLLEEIAAERERWLLFAPVAIGAGVGLYFALPVEPPLWPLLAVGVAGVALALFALAGALGLARGGPGFLILGLALAGVGGGMAAAKFRTLSVAAPVLEKRVGPVLVSGRVESVEDRAAGRRVVLENVTIPGVAAAQTPQRTRVNLRAREPVLIAGDRLRVRAVLGPPPGPAAPGAYDFQRAAYFARLGAVGFAMGRPEVISPAEGTPGPPAAFDGAALWLSRLRYDITARVRDGIGGAEGAVAAALMTGEQAAIPDDVIAAMRNSGLAHLLAVSGFNFVLIAGMLFFVARAALALIPPVALRFPTKKWAAALALLGGAAYFAITGDSIATERAFIMVSLVFIAVIADRTPISMRTLAWAATLVLLVQPESLLGASFQLSFAAVAALIAVYEDWGSRAFDSLVAPDGGGGGSGRWWRIPGAYLAGIVLTSVIAGAATAPLLVYHFNRFAIYGLLANLLAVPLTAAWIMPWALCAFALLPFGLEQFALTPMGWGVEALVWIAETTSALPAAVIDVPAMPAASIVVVSLGGLWLCLWRRRWRLAGLPIIAGAMLLGLFAMRSPDILVNEDAKLMAVRATDGGLYLSSNRAAKLHGETWLRRAGLHDPSPWPKNGASADGALTCDALGCLYRARGQVAALALGAAALAEDCGTASVVVSLVPVRGSCRGPLLVVDRFDVWRRGGHAIWLDPGGVKAASVRDWQGRRPWVPVRDPKRRGGN